MELANIMTILEPNDRIKKLSSFGNLIEIDPKINIIKYYRSGNEMVRMANVYFSEGELENAYILFIKFMTLFIEKLKTHPGFKDPSISEMKKANKEKLLEVMPIAEKLKSKLLEKYKKEYAQFLIEQEKERKIAEEAKEKAIQNAKNKALVIPHQIPGVMPSAPDLTELDRVVYPNDFPTDPQKSKDSGGLLLPESSTNKPARPVFDRNTKPSFSLVEGGLRKIHIPDNTMSKFLKVAQSNTSNNVETCGILAGKLKQHQLFITHCILPKQSGTADSCNTNNEEDIFEYQDQHNLITLGWIHTHPSQTAFLSSVDLHTQAAYQIMMNEAVAIVCAPKYQETGFFCLTPSYGLDYISQCRLDGFHPHPNDPPLYMEALHCNLDTESDIILVDLRR